MNLRRWPRLLLAASLLIGGSVVFTPRAAAVGAWLPAPAPPNGGSIVPLPDERLLVIGNDQLATYEPAVNAWSSRPSAAFVPDRGSEAPAPLPDGRVLFSGGTTVRPDDPTRAQSSLSAAQLYDSRSATWTAAAPMATARSRHTATTLQDGTVLVVGGYGGASAPAMVTASTERYDPRTDRWSPAGTLLVARAEHTATLLNDGRVLVVGGVGTASGTAVATVELYDPTTNAWRPAGMLTTPRATGHTATLLADGQVLVVGGTQPGRTGTDGPFLSAVERFDPSTDAWATAAPLRTARAGQTATLLPTGQVLVAGGSNVGATLASTELYDPARDGWAAAAPLGTPRAGHTAARLADGQVLVVGGGSAELYADSTAAQACFPETGQCVRGAFYTYWRAHGGLAINGYPLSAEQVEVLENGQPYTVQYFERVRMEYHPENQPPYDVLLGQFGRRVLRESENPSPPDTAPVTPIAGQAYFPETGHNLGGGFLDYWQANGGLAQFGFPLTEVITENLTGGTYQVQYFERARMEYHPENQAPYDIELGQFGRRILAESDALAGERSFALLYLTNEQVQALLGPPAASGNHPPGAYQAPGAFQPFEHGAMIYQGDIRGIYVLCGDEQAGRTLVPQRSRPTFWGFDDTWDPTQPIGGGPGPQPGLYEPARGVGKVWRENQAVRDCLGYATTPDETTYTIVSQQFLRGVLLTATTPTGQFVYVLYGGQPGAGGPFYERHIDPAP